MQSDIKERELYFQTRRGSLGDSLIIKNFYLQNRIGGKQRTEFHQICQERCHRQTKKDLPCGYIVPKF